MSYYTTDTIIVHTGIDIQIVFEKVDTIFKNVHFSLSTDETFWLEDFIKTDVPTSGEYEIKTLDDANVFVEKLKVHCAGGTVSYQNDDFYVLIAFESLNDKEICAVKIYVQDSLVELNESFFRSLFTKIKTEIGALTIIQGSELNPRWDEEPLIEAVLQGNLSRYNEFVVE